MTTKKMRWCPTCAGVGSVRIKLGAFKEIKECRTCRGEQELPADHPIFKAEEVRA